MLNAWPAARPTAELGERRGGVIMLFDGPYGGVKVAVDMLND
jgi:hypothetical protein